MERERYYTQRFSQRLTGELLPVPAEIVGHERLKPRERILIDGFHYIIGAKIGEGATSSVFSASELDGRGNVRPVAIKEILLGCLDADPAQALMLFNNEVQSLQAVNELQHPAFPIFYRSATDATNERAFIVMERIDGTPLDEHLEAGERLTSSEINALIITIGGALAAMHRWSGEQALWHGDIKPGNIIRTMNLDRPFVATDLGNAAETMQKRHAPTHERLRHASKRVERIGSLPYIDQHHFETGAHTTQNDVYCFGATLLELVSPQSIKDFLVARGLPLEAVLDRTKGPLLQQLAELAPVDAKLKRVMLRSLSLDPAERPRDMREFLHELGTKRLYWHRDLDGLLTIDFPWLESFPQDLQGAISEYVAFVDDAISNPDSILNLPLPTVPVFIDGETRPTLDEDGLKLWQKQVTALRNARCSILAAWVSPKQERSISSRLSDLLTYCEDLLFDHLSKDQQIYHVHPAVDLSILQFDAPEILLEAGLNLQLKSPLDHVVLKDTGEKLSRFRISPFFRQVQEPEPRGGRLYVSGGHVYEIGGTIVRELSQVKELAWLQKTPDLIEVHRKVRNLLWLQRLHTQEADERLVGVDAVRVWIEEAREARDWNRIFALFDQYAIMSELDDEHDHYLYECAKQLAQSRGASAVTALLEEHEARTEEGALKLFSLTLDPCQFSPRDLTIMKSGIFSYTLKQTDPQGQSEEMFKVVSTVLGMLYDIQEHDKLEH